MHPSQRSLVRSSINATLSRAIFSVILALGLFVGLPSYSDGAAPGAYLQVDAPAQVGVGQPIVLNFIVHDAASLAGYEVKLLYDTSVAELSSLRQRTNDLTRIGRDVQPIGPVESADGSVFGLYSCPTADCGRANAASRHAPGGSGSVKLAMVSLIAEEPGPLEIRLDNATFVTPTGTALRVTIRNPTFVVQVGPRGAGRRHSAPATTKSSAPAATHVSRGPLDLTGDSVVNHADLMEVALAWTLVRENGASCGATIDATRDINRDGCIDVADLQIITESMTTTTADSETPDDATTSDTVNAAARLTLVVNSTGDGPDARIGDRVCRNRSNVCTLRAAIAEANAHRGPDRIVFKIRGFGPHTIQLNSMLPPINDLSGGLTIDGYTESGSSPNSDPRVSNAVIKIQIAGRGASRFDGLLITAPNNLVRGLAFFRLHRSIWLYGDEAHDNRLIGNFVGTDASGTIGASVYAPNATGIYINQGAARTRIGGPAPRDRNVVSGNGRHGIDLHSEGTDGTVISHNLIGLAPGGNRSLRNWRHGIDLNRGVSSSLIERNVISGNGESIPDNYTAGIEISHDTLTSGNQVLGNYIGTDVFGTSAPTWAANSHYGMRIEDGVNNNTISDNVIGNNPKGGIQLDGYYTTHNRFSNNRIGVSLDGSPIPNGSFGIQITRGARHTWIGPNNIIANNPAGVLIPTDDTDFITITQNSIYNNSVVGLDLGPFGGVNPNDTGDVDTGANEGLNFPVLTDATPTLVTGSSCSGYTVEIFLAERLLTDRDGGRYGQGKIFLGAVRVSDDGAFSVDISGIQPGDYVTATATDHAGNTSEFARNIIVRDDTPPGARADERQEVEASARNSDVTWLPMVSTASEPVCP